MTGDDISGWTENPAEFEWSQIHITENLITIVNHVTEIFSVIGDSYYETS